MKTINLDKFREEVVGITLDGITYKVPGQLPIGITFALMEYQEALEEKNFEKIENITKNIYEIFKIHQPNLDYDKFKNLLDINTLAMIINYLQAGIEPEETNRIMNEAIENYEPKKNQNADNGKK